MILFGIAAVLALAPDGQARGGFERHTGLLDFSYSWSAEAAAVPEIVSDFHNQAEMFYSEILEKTSAKQIYSERWRTAGTTPLLLSLIGAGFHGGATARPKSWINVLLWDRKAGWISSFDALLAQLMCRDPRSSSSSMIAPACPSRTFMTMRGLSDSNRPASRSELEKISPADRGNGRWTKEHMFSINELASSPNVRFPPKPDIGFIMRAEHLLLHRPSIHEKNATMPPMLSCSPWARIAGRRLLRQQASSPRSQPCSMTASIASP
jgi:hypothetical protein